jgi:hypothetical protein
MIPRGRNRQDKSKDSFKQKQPSPSQNSERSTFSPKILEDVWNSNGSNPAQNLHAPRVHPKKASVEVSAETVGYRGHNCALRPYRDTTHIDRPYLDQPVSNNIDAALPTSQLSEISSLSKRRILILSVEHKSQFLFSFQFTSGCGALLVSYPPTCASCEEFGT